MLGLVGTENLGWLQGRGEVLEGFYHMGKNAKSWVVSKIWKSQIFIEFLFKREKKRLNSQNKFEREPTEKKFQKIQTPMFEKIKSFPKQRKFLRGRFSERKFKWPLFKNHKVFFDENQIKILECHNTYPLRKNLVPEISADP